ncbi:hypothetical protein ciss_18470, partial [Carboxydothermus islandicus]
PVTFNYKKIEVKNNKAEVILVLEIDNQQAYPPFISSGINSFELKKEKGNWKIINHDYMKLEMFEISKTKKLPELNLEEMQKSIDADFESKNGKEIKCYDENKENLVSIFSLPAQNHNYDSYRAVFYANKYVKNPNPKFYTAPINVGDCTNFASQVLWYGFGANDTTTDIANKVMMVPGSSYTEGWYAGSGGGSRNWESVTYFWSYMTSYKSIDTPGPRVTIVTSFSQLNNGGIMQIDFEQDGIYNHTAILVDKNTQKFAQHTVNDYFYFSDYGGNKRYFNPSHFREIL